MIELNLLPQELKKKKRKIELPEIPLVPIAVGLLGALILLQLFLSGLIFVSKKQLTSLDKTWKDLAPKKAELDGIKKEVSSIEKRTGAIDGLIEKRLNWSRLLNELSSTLTPNIWLTELAYSEKVVKVPVKKQPAIVKQKTRRPGKAAKQTEGMVRTLTLSGFASGRGEETTANVARFIRSLKTSAKDFQEVELVSMKKSVVAEQDVMNFTLVCRFGQQRREARHSGGQGE